MSNLSQFIGGSRPPKLLVNQCSDGSLINGVPTNGTITILSGALTAATLKSVLTISGAGAVKYLGLRKLDTTSRTIRLKITIDGVAVFDATSAVDTVSTHGFIAVGNRIDASFPILDSVTFNSSLVVEVASSLSETDKLVINTIYETR